MYVLISKDNDSSSTMTFGPFDFRDDAIAFANAFIKASAETDSIQNYKLWENKTVYKFDPNLDFTFELHNVISPQNEFFVPPMNY